MPAEGFAKAAETGEAVRHGGPHGSGIGPGIEGRTAEPQNVHANRGCQRSTPVQRTDSDHAPLQAVPCTRLVGYSNIISATVAILF
jgi:hypothetical protein